jgi:ABC-2 type transport system permease protein
MLLTANGFAAPLDGVALRASAGSVLYLGLVALSSTGVAAAARSGVAALVIVLGLLYLLPIAAPFAGGGRWSAWIGTYAPMPAGLAVQTADPGSVLIEPWAGLGVLALYAATALLVGGTLFAPRDAG